MTTQFVRADDVGPKATFDYITAAVALDAQARFCQTGEKWSPLERAEHKALLIYLRTNWPAAVQVSPLGHYRVLSSDGVTLYDVTRDAAGWRCTCPAHGPCWHTRFSYLCFCMRAEKLPIDAFAPKPEPIEAGDGQVRSMAGRSRLYQDEVA